MGTALAEPSHERSEKGEKSCRAHRVVSCVRPDFQSVLLRHMAVPATHQDQGVGILAVERGVFQAPGAIRLPRKSSSSAGRVHRKGLQVFGCPEGLQHILARDRRTDPPPGERRRGGSNQAMCFEQAPILAPSPARSPSRISVLGRRRPCPS